MLIVMIIISLAFLPLVIIRDLSGQGKQENVVVFKGENRVVVQTPYLRATFDKNQGYALSKLEDQIGEDLIQNKAFYVAIRVYNMWSDLYDSNATLSFLNENESQVILRINTQLIPRWGGEPFGLNVEKIYTFNSNSPCIQVNIKTTVVALSPLTDTEWFLEFMGNLGYKYWAYGDENIAISGEYEKLDDWAYISNSAKWMTFYGGAREFALGLIVEDVRTKTKEPIRMPTAFRSYDGTNPSGQFVWSRPEKLHYGDTASANITIFISRGDYTSTWEYAKSH